MLWISQLWTIVSLSPCVSAEPPKWTVEQEAFFESEVRPLLIEQCYRCHSEGKNREGGLLLDRRQGLLEGGDSGPAVAVGKPAESLLILAVKHDANVSAMPPRGKTHGRAKCRRWSGGFRWGCPIPATVVCPK